MKHRRYLVFGAEEGTRQIGIQHVAPPGHRHILDGPRLADSTGIVERDVESSKPVGSWNLAARPWPSRGTLCRGSCERACRHLVGECDAVALQNTSSERLREVGCEAGTKDIHAPL